MDNLKHPALSEHLTLLAQGSTNSDRVRPFSNPPLLSPSVEQRALIDLLRRALCKLWTHHVYRYCSNVSLVTLYWCHLNSEHIDIYRVFKCIVNLLDRLGFLCLYFRYKFLHILFILSVQMCAILFILIWDDCFLLASLWKNPIKQRI